MYVYISTEYNIKLQDLYFLRYLQKTDFGTSDLVTYASSYKFGNSMDNITSSGCICNH